MSADVDVLAGLPLRRTPSQARSRDKVARALGVAETIAVRDGLEAVTLTSVADEAGLSVGAVHQYLPDRDTIIAALTARYHARIEALMDDVLAEGVDLDAVDPIGLLIARIAQVYREEAAARALRSAGIATHDSRPHKARMTAKLHDLLVDADLISAADTTASRAVFVIADALMHEAFHDRDEPDADLLAELSTVISAYLDAR